MRKKFDIPVLFWFLMTRFINYFLLIFLSLNLVIFIINFNKLSFKLSDVGFSTIKIFKFCLLLLPLFSFQTLPFVVFFSIFFCTNIMFISNEILSFYSIGYSFKKIIKFGISVSFILFFLSLILQFIFPIFFSMYGDGRKVDLTLMIKNLKPRVLNQINENTLINFDRLNSKGDMENVYIFVKNEDNMKIFLAKKANFSKKNNLKLNSSHVSYFNIDKAKNKYHYHNIKENELDMDFFSKNFNNNNFNESNPKLKRIDFLIKDYLFYKKIDKNIVLEEVNRRILIPIEVFVLAVFNFFNLFQMKSPRLEGARRNIYSFFVFWF